MSSLLTKLLRVTRDEQLELRLAHPGPDEPIAALAAAALKASDEVWVTASQLAAELRGRALMPVLAIGRTRGQVRSVEATFGSQELQLIVELLPAAKNR